jgi:hypothetical protein
MHRQQSQRGRLWFWKMTVLAERLDGGDDIHGLSKNMERA